MVTVTTVTMVTVTTVTVTVCQGEKGQDRAVRLIIRCGEDKDAGQGQIGLQENKLYDSQTDSFSLLDVSPPSAEPGWSSEGTGRGGRNAQRGVFGDGVTIRGQRTRIFW
jgi:hypothetical protein